MLERENDRLVRFGALSRVVPAGFFYIRGGYVRLCGRFLALSGALPVLRPSRPVCAAVGASWPSPPRPAASGGGLPGGLPGVCGV